MKRSRKHYKVVTDTYSSTEKYHWADAKHHCLRVMRLTSKPARVIDTDTGEVKLKLGGK